jgi:NAD(P)-dependent dehydrogenase (short-subunit alcohol dehydrogenase family)
MKADLANPFDLTGRVAIVTGAGSPTRIGMATASLLVGLGAAVLVTSSTSRVQDRAAELQSAGGSRLARRTSPGSAWSSTAATRSTRSVPERRRRPVPGPSALHHRTGRGRLASQSR